MEINKTKILSNLQYYPKVTHKDSIFLHHTAGMNADGAISWWNQTPDKVGTAYVIDRDGTIFETFPPDRWGYHLGIVDDDNYMEKHSVGIEIVAAGQLYKEGEKYMFYPLSPNKTAAKEIPLADVLILPTEWRGFKYYHAYTEKQISSTIELISSLISTFGIKVQDNLKDFFEYNDLIYKNHLPGIWSHSSVRKDKVDIVPYKSFLDKIYSSFSKVETTKSSKKK